MQGAEDAAAFFLAGFFDLLRQFVADDDVLLGAAAVHDAQYRPAAAAEDGADVGGEIGGRLAPGGDIHKTARVAELRRRRQQVYLRCPENAHGIIL